jgi:predicted PurR-regulated permease PerM
MNSETVVEIGTRLILRVALIATGAYFLYLLRDIVLLVLLAVLTAAAFYPLIARLDRWKFSRTGAVVVVYLGFLALIVAMVAVFIPLFISEVKNFSNAWPMYGEKLSGILSALEAYFRSFGVEFSRDQFFSEIEAGLSQGAGNIVATTVGIFSGLIHFLGYFFLALYLSLEENGIEKFFLALAPEQYHARAAEFAGKIRVRVSRWLGAQLLLMAIVFVIYYIGLSLFGVPYALAIALFGGLVEIVPYIGPILAAIPAVLLGLLEAPVVGFSVLAYYVVAHQLESHIIAPQVMKHSAGLNPVVLIVAVLIGLELGGAIGVLLAVPIAMIAGVFVEDFMEKRQGSKQ